MNFRRHKRLQNPPKVFLASSLLLGLVGAATATVSFQVLDRLALARAGSAYAAKMLCSGVFMAGMDDARLWQEELSQARSFVNARILPDRGEVVAETLFGTVTARAKRQANLGCSLYQEGSPPVALPGQVRPASSDPQDVTSPWVLGPSSLSHPPAGIDQVALQRALAESFQEPDPQKPRRTRAVVVVQNGWVVGERYAPGITAATPLIGWSVTKAVTHALIGIAVKEKLLDLKSTVPVPEWTSPTDPRRGITLEQLLRMSSGLSFSEVYDDLTSDVVTMLLHTADSGAYAAKKPLEAQPGTVWHYSSGTTNILSRGLRLALADDEAYWRFPYERLFQPLGMHSAVLETDPSGTFVGSSLAYATARDWARFGLLYLNGGRWGERRLLPEGWVEHATTPTPGSDQTYGAHWGLNRSGRYPDIPRDAFYARGFGGQLVLIVPSRRTVIVRLGQTPGEGFDINAFAMDVLSAL